MANRKKTQVWEAGWCSYKKKKEYPGFIVYEDFECAAKVPSIKNIRFDKMMMWKTKKKGGL